MTSAGAPKLQFTATPPDIDELGHVNNAVWVQWIQDVAVSHWSALASAAQVEAYVWVVVRHEIDYRRPLLPGGTVTARTWLADAPRGARFDRYVSFTDADGTEFVRSLTTWAMIDRRTGRPQRVTAEVIDRFRA